VLSRNVGNGAVEIQFVASAGAVSYNVYLSTSLAGTYTKANMAAITGTTCRLPNFPFGVTVYFKVTAVNAAGEESALSSVAQDAICSPGTATLQFTDLVGGTIPAGKVFLGKTTGGRPLAFVTTARGVAAAVTWKDAGSQVWKDAGGVAWHGR
jgi:hypothetical protein